MADVLEAVLYEEFCMASLVYARKFSKLVRRVFECVALMAAVSGFFILVYMHIGFSKTEVTCLEHVKDTWPRDGILRIEIIKNVNEHYTTEQSYTKEERSKQEKLGYLSLLLNLLGLDAFFNTESAAVAAREIYPGLSENSHIFEYSLEYVFLLLSPATRKRLKIPVQIVTLDPNKDACFGNAFSRIILEEIVGYTEMVTTSVKILTGQEANKGYLRSGEEYYKISSFKGKTLYFAALSYIFGLILVVTVESFILLHLTSNLLILLMDLVMNRAILILISACVAFGIYITTIINSAFFNGLTITPFILLNICIGEVYVAIFVSDTFGKDLLKRFLYFYHICFYAYYYRFNGQYGSLVIATWWLFSLHSMIYYYHHLELPKILSPD